MSKKKISLFICAMVLTFSFVGCSKAETKEVVKSDKIETITQSVKKIEPAFSSDIKDTGKGKIELVNESGSSNDGSVVIFEDKDIQIMQIGFNAAEFDGAKLSYIYIDNVVNTNEQLGDTQISLDLKGDTLKVGKHKVEVAQFDTDKTDGKVITYKTVSYEVKAK
ncbi:MAG: hypothetical protein ACREVX_11535 [Clostridium sp.]|uniref:hypothetical protein n=1 Tax=Clostridium sp. TaxID=1506 RepID=UPI003D6C8352